MSLQDDDIFFGKALPYSISRKSDLTPHRAHLDKYWSMCVESGFTPTTPKDWVAPFHWVPPNEQTLVNS